MQARMSSLAKGPDAVDTGVCVAARSMHSGLNISGCLGRPYNQTHAPEHHLAVNRHHGTKDKCAGSIGVQTKVL